MEMSLVSSSAFCSSYFIQTAQQFKKQTKSPRPPAYAGSFAKHLSSFFKHFQC